MSTDYDFVPEDCALPPATCHSRTTASRPTSPGSTSRTAPWATCTRSNCPCGLPAGSSQFRGVRVPASPCCAPDRWRYTWLKESIVAHQASAFGARVPFVLSDIRLDIDHVLSHGEDPLQIINLTDVEFADESVGPLSFARYDRTVLMKFIPRSDLRRTVAALSSGGSTLLTNLSATTRASSLRLRRTSTVSSASTVGSAAGRYSGRRHRVRWRNGTPPDLARSPWVRGPGQENGCPIVDTAENHRRC